MSWKEVSPGCFKRPVDAHEEFLTAVGFGHELGLEHWGVSTVGKIDHKLPDGDIIPSLRRAWRAVRYYHPEVAATIKDGSWIYEVPDESSCEAWLEESFIVEPASATSETLIPSLGIPFKPTVHYLPGSSEIILYVSHKQIDAIGGLKLLSRLLELVAEPTDPAFGGEGRNLYPSFEALAGCPEQSTPDAEAVAKEAFSNTSHLPSVGLPYKGDMATLPGRPACEGITLAEKVSKALVRACKEKGISVTAAVAAAVTMVSYELTPWPEAKSRNLTPLVPLNLRPHLPVSEYNPADAVTSYTTGLLPTVPPGKTWSEYAASFNAQIRKVYSKEFINALRAYGELWAPAFAMAPPPDIPPPSDVCLSSLGIVDPHFQRVTGKIKIKSVRVEVQMLTRQVTLYLWTFDGQLNISACYNQAYHDVSTVQELLERYRDVLGKSLNIDLR
ncbi:MAG: hypothetical protein M1821_006842 [Bathelium mastoideum]|nr:MAG: hypothetical protein M1821_006842 [Bathelium mastoideum]